VDSINLAVSSDKARRPSAPSSRRAPSAKAELPRSSRHRVQEYPAIASGDENGSDSMKYCEVIADKLHASGWSWGYFSAVTKDGWRWIVDAHREGRRYIVPR
jgi:hypothetical protein